MLQDIAPYTFCNDFSWAEPEATDRILVYRGASVLVSLGSDNCCESEGQADATIHFPTYAMLEEAGVVGSVSDGECLHRADGTIPKAFLLFTVEDTAYFRCEVSEDALDALIDGKTTEGMAGGRERVTWQFVPTSALRHYAPKYRAFAGLVGYEYDSWYATRRFCGACGTPLVHDMVERMVRCPECGTMEFPKLFPAVIVGIVDRERDKVLVSRYANREYKRYALIAGFCEMGETVEETVHREVMEEVGLKVKNLRYYKNQPWPPSSSLLFGFFCELDGSNRIRLDDHELECAEWIDRSQLPVDEDYSLTREIMQVLRDRREGA